MIKQKTIYPAESGEGYREEFLSQFARRMTKAHPAGLHTGRRENGDYRAQNTYYGWLAFRIAKGVEVVA